MWVVGIMGRQCAWHYQGGWVNLAQLDGVLCIRAADAV